MNPLQLIALASALSVATLTLCAALAFSRLRLPASCDPRPQPWVFRAFRTPIALIADAIDRHAPPRGLAAVASRLARAQFDAAVSASQWLGATALLAAALLGGAVVVVNLVASDIGSFAIAVTGAVGMAALPELWLRSRIDRIGRRMVRELPGFLDMLTLALESGASLVPALTMAVERGGDDPLRSAVRNALQDMRAGHGRADALAAMASRYRLAEIRLFVAALRQADASGASLGGLLRAQSSQRLAERFARAEKLAMEAPTRMLVPLILCIFPCTFIVLAFPLVVRLAAGW